MGWNRVRQLATASMAVAGLVLAGCSGSGGAGDDGAQSGDPARSTTAATGPSGEFSLLTYNVAGLPIEVSKEHPDVNIPKISPKLDAYDVVVTQEDFDWWPPEGLAAGLDFVHYHERLRADTTQPHRTERHPGPEAVDLDLDLRPAPEIGDGLGVLSIFPISPADRVPWTNCFGGFDTSDGGAADCLAMKGFLHTRLTLADGVEVDLYDLHGEAGGSDRDQDLQADDFAQLADYIVANSKGRAVIVAGDTNLHTDREHPDSKKGADIGIWDDFLEATGLTDSCAATSCDDPSRIDKVAFRSDGGVDLEATSHAFQTDVFVDEDGADLSDHQALEVAFSWRAA